MHHAKRVPFQQMIAWCVVLAIIGLRAHHQQHQTMELAQVLWLTLS